MARKIPMSQEGRAREARRQRKLAFLSKVGVLITAVIAIVAWGLLVLDF